MRGRKRRREFRVMIGDQSSDGAPGNCKQQVRSLPMWSGKIKIYWASDLSREARESGASSRCRRWWRNVPMRIGEPRAE